MLPLPHDAKEVVLKGWVHRARLQQDMVHRCSRPTGHVQCVAKREIVGDECFESLRNALIESSVEIKGIVEPTDREHGHEVQVTSATVIGPVNPDRPFPITESAMEESDGGETEFLLDNRHLYLRTRRMTTMLKIRSTVLGQSTHTSVTETSLSTRPQTSLQARWKVEAHCSKSHTSARRHTSPSLGSSMQRQLCQPWSVCTQWHPHFEPRRAGQGGT